VVVFFSLFTVVFKKYFLGVYLSIIFFYVFCSAYWIFIGTGIADVVYSLLYVFLAIGLLVSVKRNNSLKGLLINFYFILVLLLSILSIISFMAFNMKLAPYELKPVGEGLDVYYYYHNYLLGYINPKLLESGMIGRVCGFLFEPSYQGWFLSTNFFLVSKFIKNKSYVIIIQSIVLLGALASFSTMSWIVFIIVFASMAAFKVMSTLGIQEKSANILYAFVLFLGVVAMFTVVNKDNLLEILGPSSSDDRTERADMSFLYIATASPQEILLGRGSGFIGVNSGKGESNPIIKSLVENGLVSTILVLIFVIYCTYRSKFYMIASLLWLNSVVILFTPLFIVNILVCRWIDEKNNKF
jgi:hypothetical protein